MNITSLTIRQFLRSRSLIVVAIICLLPALVALVPLFVTDQFNIRDLRRLLANNLFLSLYVPTLLPLATLVLTTSALGDEIEDKTLHLLALKPISRFRIVLEKWLAAVITLVPVVWASLMVVWTLIAWGNFSAMTDLIGPMLLSSLVAILGFGSVFLLISLLMRRSLLLGVFYVTIWETTLAGFLTGIRDFSISHYTKSLFVNMVEDRRIVLDNPASNEKIVIVIACVVLISLAGAAWRLRSMAID